MRIGVKAAVVVLMLSLLGGIVSSEEADWPEAEFHMARVKYRTFGGAGSRGITQPWWAIDYPYAEEHFFSALRRLTNISVSEDSRHLELSDDRIFQYPFLFLQQPGAGNWRPTDKEAANLRQHLPHRI